MRHCKRNISFLSPVDRPREKLRAKGGDALSNTDLLAILIGSGIKGKSVMDVAETLLKRFGMKGIPLLNFDSLSAHKGIGEARACVILASIELGKRLFQAEDPTAQVVDGPESVYQLVKDLAHHKKEHFVALYLNAKNHLLKRETISIGSLFANMVHPREVFSPALQVSAAALVLSHNHPSGDPEPSPEDRALTRRLVEGGKLMGVDVLDHLVVGSRGYVSFREKGFM